MTVAHSMVFAAMLAAGTALAQTAAPAAATPAPTNVTAAANCPKPDAHPGRLASDNARRGWGKEVQTWTDCMKKFVADIQRQADEAVKTANAAVARSNAAVDEYNAVVKDLQAQNDAAQR
jgi:hypothetical protein